MDAMSTYGEKQNHEPLRMHLVEGFTHITGAGDFYWQKDQDGNPEICLAVPEIGVGHRTGKTHTLIRLPVRKAPQVEGQRYWTWDGEELMPTLLPSIGVFNVWHGYVRGGYLVEA